MLLPIEFKEKFIIFTENKIDFHTEHKKFRVNDLWLDEIDDKIFHLKIYEFVDNLKAILISCNNNLLIVDELKTILQHKISWYNTNKIINFSSFFNFEYLINDVNYNIEYDIPEIYTIENILNFETIEDKIEEPIVYAFLGHKSITKDYENNLDFEKVKLFFILNQHYKSLMFFEEQIDNIKNAIQVYGVTDLSRYIPNNPVPTDKCNIKLDKISSAFLFKILIEAELIYMDAEPGRSETKIKKFAETNFNYTDSNGHAKPLTEFTKEYSKSKGIGRKEKQLEVLNILSKFIQKKITYLNK